MSTTSLSKIFLFYSICLACPNTNAALKSRLRGLVRLESDLPSHPTEAEVEVEAAAAAAVAAVLRLESFWRRCCSLVQPRLFFDHMLLPSHQFPHASCRPSSSVISVFYTTSGLKVEPDIPILLWAPELCKTGFVVELLSLPRTAPGSDEPV
ncbi:hypothetical protein B0T17DRAFT_176986 [Bombardia bombarda]|uniref:Uncharacterized protein n=1 Tax=Bombardia bombarda TaxID=252184 RepID=A0AA40C9F1_9PEZI|nr:hypothetical protein B0T17DRAFT_176986 [Bombardia bombarda]